MRIVNGIEEIVALEGETLEPSDWIEVTQQAIDQFAEATQDRQWIHVDRVRAAAGPHGHTIAHGFLTLSFIPRLMAGIWRLEGLRMAINYGLDRVRFITPVPVGARIRGVASVKQVERIADDAVQVSFQTTIELEGSEKPAAVVQQIGRYYAG